MIALIALLFLTLEDTAATPAFIETTRTLPGEGVGILLADFTGDGALDLLEADEAGIALFPLAEDGTYPSDPSDRVDWTGERVGWDVGDLDGDGVEALVLVLESGRVLAHRASAAGVIRRADLSLSHEPCH